MPPSQIMQANGTSDDNSHSNNHHSPHGGPEHQGHQHQQAHYFVAATDLIRQLDAAFGTVHASIVEGAREAEVARKNARRAGELARRFAVSSATTVPNRLLLDDWDAPAPAAAHPHQETTRGPLAPPPAPHPPQHPSQTNGDPFPTFSPARFSHSTSKTPSSTTTRSGSGTQHRHKPTAEQRWAQQHAEDLLQVSLELERTKQQLEQEQMSHDETKAALQRARYTIQTLERDRDDVVQRAETEREDLGRHHDALQEQVEQLQQRLHNAEEEADDAVQVAQHSDAQRKEMEQWLQRAVDEIVSLKQFIQTHDIRGNSHAHAQLRVITNDLNDHENEAEDFHPYVDGDDRTPTHADPMDATTPAPSTTSATRRPTTRSAMAVAGRQLLQQHRRQQSPHSADASSSAPHRRRQQQQQQQHWRNRLQGLIRDNDTTADWTASPPLTSSGGVRHGLGPVVASLDVCRNAAQVLKESGYRLHLTGRWWNADPMERDHHDEIHLETLARHYTAAVEVLLDRKHKEVQELESLCTLLEGGKISPRAASS